MKADEQLSGALNQQQVMMLRLLKTPLPDADFKQIRKLAVQLLAKQLDATIDDWEENNAVTTETYNELSKQHFRSSKQSS